MKDVKKFISQNKLLAVVIGYLVIVLIALPLTLLNVQKPSQSRSSAAASTVLSFSPSSAQASIGDTVAYDVMVDPGTNLVSFATLDINYDPTVLAPADANPFVAYNPPDPATALRNVIEGPVYDSGRIRVKISAGTNPGYAIATPQKIATVSFKVIGSGSSQITYGPTTYLLSISPNDSATDNVLASSQPASITVGAGGGPTATSVPPTGVGGNPTSVPTFAPTDGPTSTPIATTAPTPSCTPLPAECAVEGANCTPPANGYCTGEPTPTSGTGGPTPTDIPIACQKIQPADIVLVIDVSGSMKGDKIKNAKESAKSFVKIVQKDPKNRVALVSFSTTATLNVPLTTDFNTLNAAIDKLGIKATTCTKCGIEAGDNELATNGNADAKKVIVLLTDGKANVGGTVSSGKDKFTAAEEAALATVQNAKAQGLLIYSIGIGSDVNPGFLQQISAKGAYYFAASPVQINANFINVYTSLNNAICSGQPIVIPSISIPVTPTSGGNINAISIIMLTLLLIPVLLLLGHMFL